MNNSVNVQNENNNELKKAILIGIIVSIVGSIVVILILKFLIIVNKIRINRYISITCIMTISTI